MSLVMFKLLGELGVDVVLGSVQCFGVFMGYGGFYVVFFVICDSYKCLLLGCIIGVSKDICGCLVFCMVL